MKIAVISNNSTIENIIENDVLPEANGNLTFMEVSEANLAYLQTLINGESYFPPPPQIDPPTLTESVDAYLKSEVNPFVKELVRNFTAENIAMGVTQAGKSGDVLGLYEQNFIIVGIAKPISLKAALESGSLYVTRTVIQHIRDNPTEYADMAPFITDARLLSIKNQIETFLGIPLTPP